MDRGGDEAGKGQKQDSESRNGGTISGRNGGQDSDETANQIEAGCRDGEKWRKGTTKIKMEMRDEL